MPVVIDRRRIEFTDPKIPGSKQPYHAAAELDLKEAESYLSRCTTSARLLAQQALLAVVGELQESGHEMIGCGVLLGASRPTKPLSETLASHPLIHTAEGELFRQVILRASEDCGLPITTVRERELWASGACRLGLPVDALESRITEMGRSIGRPWRQDEKYSALVAWLAFVGLGFGKA